MADGLRRLSAELAGLPQQGDITCRLETAVVATVTPAGAADGNALVTVTWAGAEHAAAYLASYTPVVADVVAVVVQPPAGLLILGQPIGTPPS
jgi:hypothetical protein